MKVLLGPTHQAFTRAGHLNITRSGRFDSFIKLPIAFSPEGFASHKHVEKRALKLSAHEVVGDDTMVRRAQAQTTRRPVQDAVGIQIHHHLVVVHSKHYPSFPDIREQIVIVSCESTRRLRRRRLRLVNGCLRRRRRGRERAALPAAEIFFWCDMWGLLRSIAYEATTACAASPIA